MSEQPPEQPNEEQGVNSYGTDNPAEQARIEQARRAASEERRRKRERLERYVESGLTRDDAEALIEFEDSAQQQREARPEAGEDTEQIRPRIYIRSLVDYNEGHDIGDWIDASQGLEDIHADVQAILARSLHAHWTGQPSEEWAIHDYEGFGSVRLHEYESLDVVCVLGKGIAEHGLAFAAWAEIEDDKDIHTLERFRDAYLGAFDSRQAYAEHIVDDLDGDKALEALPE